MNATQNAPESGDQRRDLPQTDLRPEEAADAFETPEEAKQVKQSEDDVRDDEDIITLDTPD